MKKLFISIAVTAIAAASSCSGKVSLEPLPECYDGYLDERISEIKASLSNSRSSETFIYFTDTHAVKDERTVTPQILTKAIKSLKVKDVVFGGDATMTSMQCTDKNDIDLSWEKTNATSAAVKAAGASYYPVRGNHEITSGTIMPEHKGFTYSEENIYNIVMAPTRDEKIVEKGDTTCNYYFDNRRSRIRHIVVDPYSAADEDLEVRYGIAMEHNDDAAEWVGHCVETLPEGWHIILFIHQGLNPITGYSDYGNCRAIRDIVNANTDKFTMVLHGHVHKDCETFENGVFHVCSTSCLYYEDKMNIFGKDDRTFGTTNENAIDVVDFNPEGGRIDFHRIGGGYSRLFNITPIEMSSGESICLEPHMKNVDGWKIYDCEGLHCTSWADWSDAYCDNFHAVCEDGRITALAPGEAIAAAIDTTSRAREYFYIVVK